MSDDCALVVSDVRKSSRNLPPSGMADGLSDQVEETLYEPSVFGVGVVCAEVRGVCGKIAARNSDKTTADTSQISLFDTYLLNRGGGESHMRAFDCVIAIRGRGWIFADRWHVREYCRATGMQGYHTGEVSLQEV